MLFPLAVKGYFTDACFCMNLRIVRIRISGKGQFWYWMNDILILITPEPNVRYLIQLFLPSAAAPMQVNIHLHGDSYPECCPSKISIAFLVEAMNRVSAATRYTYVSKFLVSEH